MRRHRQPIGDGLCGSFNILKDHAATVAPAHDAHVQPSHLISGGQFRRGSSRRPDCLSLQKYSNRAILPVQWDEEGWAIVELETAVGQTP
jgi:hypothetical protein